MNLNKLVFFVYMNHEIINTYNACGSPSSNNSFSKALNVRLWAQKESSSEPDNLLTLLCSLLWSLLGLKVTGTFGAAATLGLRAKEIFVAATTGAGSGF